MEYVIIGGIAVAIALGMLVRVIFFSDHETKAEQQENEDARKRASAAESFREQYEAQLPTRNQLQNFRRSPPAAPPTRQVRNDKRPSPPPAPPMRKLGGNSSAFSAGYGSSSPAPVRDPSMDVLTTVLLVDALTPDSVPEAKTPYVDAPYDHGKPEATPERLPDPTPTYVEPDRTDYGSSSRNDDSGWSSSSSSDSGWSSSDSGSSSSYSSD